MLAIYFDCFAGASGDMIIGALLDLGVELETLKEQLSGLDLSDYELKSDRVTRSGIAAIKFDVEFDDARQPARHLSDIREIINRSPLTGLTKSRAHRVFERLAEAEARVHATTPDRVHFHEVGAIDSIIDVVGAMIGFEMLGIEHFIASPLRVGHGFVRAEHGLLPVPAPATAELLKGVPVYGGDLEGEFVTPTGAAIITTLCQDYARLPSIAIARAGYGAGARDPHGFPNALRLIAGEVEREQSKSDDTVLVVETNIDDMSPQVYGVVMERLFETGALDVFLTPAQMKKDRPGVMITVLCKPERAREVTALLLRETTTLGVRYYEAKRRILEREIETVETLYGSVRIKVAREGGRTLHFQPEFEDCARLADQTRTPLIEVQQAAFAAYRERLKATEENNEANGER
jgi:pyridinium-3,5-bisthiocarboxylic acid mononucleotide nickel chelatase